jgi:hypothetical protein
MPGNATSAVEVSHVSSRGIWVLVAGEELFLDYAQFPWFRDARIAQVLDVIQPSPRYLRWPQLDVDLAIESLRHPEHYPLVAR